LNYPVLNYLLGVYSSATIHFSRRRKAGIVCLLALLAATFGFTPFCDAQRASGIIFFLPKVSYYIYRENIFKYTYFHAK
jgi:hypothetical protein